MNATKNRKNPTNQTCLVGAAPSGANSVTSDVLVRTARVMSLVLRIVRTFTLTPKAARILPLRKVTGYAMPSRRLLSLRMARTSSESKCLSHYLCHFEVVVIAVSLYFHDRITDKGIITSIPADCTTEADKRSPGTDTLLLRTRTTMMPRPTRVRMLRRRSWCPVSHRNIKEKDLTGLLP